MIVHILLSGILKNINEIVKHLFDARYRLSNHSRNF